MAKIPKRIKIVTKGDDCCEHCKHVRYCTNPSAMAIRHGGGVMTEFIEKTYKAPKKWAYVEVECKYLENRSKRLDLPEIVKGLTEHQVSRFEDFDVCLYSNKEFHIVGFIYGVYGVYRKGAYYCLYPDEEEYIYKYKDIIKDWGKFFGDYECGFEEWIKEHDEELRLCFEGMDKGKAPDPF